MQYIKQVYMLHRTLVCFAFYWNFKMFHIILKLFFSLKLNVIRKMFFFWKPRKIIERFILLIEQCTWYFNQFVRHLCANIILQCNCNFIRLCMWYCWLHTQFIIFCLQFMSSYNHLSAHLPLYWSRKSKYHMYSTCISRYK